MKPNSLRTVALAAPIVSLLAVINCAPEDTTVSNTGGTTGTTAGTTGTTAGTTGTTAGTTGTTAGTSSGGSSTGTAGTPAGGTGPSAGSAGAPGGGSAGAPGGGSAGGGTVDTIDSVLSTKSDFGNNGWKDSWWVTGCNVKNGHDCITSPPDKCNAKDGQTSESKGARTVETFMIGGTPGQNYKVTFKFNAVTEAKMYTGGTRDKPDVAGDVESGISDTFYRDGSSPESNYNVIKMTIYDNTGKEARHYYMNSFPRTEFESHRTFLAAYTKSIVIVGGGKIEHLVQDKNCHAIDNCGPGNVGDGPNDCNAGRNLPNEPATLMLPAKYKDPIDDQIKNTPLLNVNGYPNATLGQPWHAQAAHLTVTALERTSDPVTMNYP